MPDLALHLMRSLIAPATSSIGTSGSAMLVEQVDAIGLEAPEATFRCGLDVLGPAVGAAAAPARLRVDVEAELVAMTT